MALQVTVGIAFFLKTRHETDTWFQSNPLYRMIGRPENPSGNYTCEYECPVGDDGYGNYSLGRTLRENRARRRVV